MKKRSTKILSLVLSLVMVFSLLPMSAFAEMADTESAAPAQEETVGITAATDAAVNGGRGFGSRPINPRPMPQYPAQTLTSEAIDGLTVTVDAPKGALPMGVEMNVTKIENLDAVQAAVDALEGVDGTALVAADITFVSNGKEIQPKKDVTVTMESDILPGDMDLTVVHLDASAQDLEDDNEAEAQPVTGVAIANNSVTFTASKFSTYTIVGQNRSVIVHYGYMNGNQFVEFTQNSTSTSFPGNGARVSYQNYDYSSNPIAYLKYDFEGWNYKETRYSTPGGTLIYPALYYYYGSYRDFYYFTQSGDYDRVGYNSNVYVIYEAKTASSGGSSQGGGSGQDDPETPDLPAGKYVTDNHDGTYDITLSVTGVEGTQETVTKASVIVIFDTSGSMAKNIAGQVNSGYNYNYVASTARHWEPVSEQRLSIAKEAVNALASTLLSKEDSNHNKLVQMALISFDTKATYAIDGFTSDLDTFTSAVNGLTAQSVTNWEHALMLANSMVVASDAPTYVVFVSDGDPTVRMSRLNLTDAEAYTLNGNDFNYEGYFGSGSYNEGHYTAAVSEAVSILTHNKTLYSIGLSTEATRMQDFTTAAYSGANVTIPANEKRYFPATSQSELTDAFDKIAEAVTDHLGFTNVSVDDGVTDLTTVETDALTGTPSNFVYRMGTSTTPGDNPEWTGEDVPQADITEDNHVIWDIASIGQLEPGVTYSVTFTIWPSQEAYNIIADINNGIIRDSDGNIVRTGTPAEAYNAQPADIRSQIVINENGEYTLLTNTGANVSYEYNGAPGSAGVSLKTDPGEMALASNYFGMHKDWSNELPQDSRTAQVLTKQDEDGKWYLVDSNGDWILDGENKIEANWDNYDSWKNKAVYYVDLIVTKGDEDYTEVRLTSEDLSADGGNAAWTWAQMFVAPGVLTHGTAASGTFELREHGDDYTVREKPSESYYWELSAEIYHPMVINGTAYVLQKVADDAAGVPDSVKGAANANKYDGDYYNIGGTVYKKLGSADDALISAVNERRSYLNLTKVVNGTDKVGYDPNAYFTYTVKMENVNGLHSGDDGYTANNDDFWFSVYDPVAGATVLDQTIVTGATAEEGNTGYWHFENVAGGKDGVTIKIKAGWNVRFTNLLTGTTYEFVETKTAMPDGFTFNKVEATAEFKGQLQTYNPTVTAADQKIQGEIEAANTNYTVTYTNDFEGVFYVYHSSNNTVERFPMAVDGVKVTSFDIAHLTLDGSLYGGYYTDYAGKSADFDATALTYTDGKATDEGEGAKPYDAAYIKSAKSSGGVWISTAYTTSGLTMEPTSNTVYYLKEVPAALYLRPYLHYSYYKDNNEIATVWLVSDTDDLKYQEAGFVIIDANKKATDVVSSLTVTTQHGGTSVKLTSKTVFGATGYLSYRKVNDVGGLKLLNNGDSVLQYWVTPDGLRVTGTASRTYSGLASKTTVDKVETAVVSTITPFTTSD